MRPMTTLALCLALLAGLAASSAGPARAAKGMEVALEDDAALVYGYYSPALTPTAALDRAKQLRVTRIRADVSWAKVLGAQASSRRVPRHLSYDWGPYDALIDAAAARGMRVQLTIAGFAPAFATSNHRIGVRSPSVKQFGRFAAAVARHFRGRVDEFSIWNEPNIAPQLQPLRRNASIYRALYLAGSSAVRRNARRAKVFIGETNPYAIPRRATAPITFLRSLACVNRRYKRVRHCKPLVADGYAHHPYEFRHAPTFRYKGADNATIGTLGHLTSALDRLARARALRDRHGKALNLYLTEYGYYSSGSRRLPEAKRASYLTKGFGIALRNRRVKSMLVYELAVPNGPSSFPMGLMKVNGSLLRSFTSLRTWAGHNKVKPRPKRIRLPRAPR